MENKELSLEEIKSYDDSIWLYILKERTVFDTEQIKAHKDWLIEQVEAYQDVNKPKPIEEWHEEDGECLWWFFPIVESPYCGSPLDVDFPNYVTHFTKLSLPIST